MGLAWDGDAGLVVIEAQAPVEEPRSCWPRTLPEDVPRTARRAARPNRAAPARAFIQRARQIVSAGRPPCPLCGLPLDTNGHVCPRHNGTTARPPRAQARRTPAPPLTRRDGRSTCSRAAKLEIEGRLVDASNATLYCTVTSAAGPDAGRLRLQAGGGRAAALGLPRRARWPSARSRPTRYRRRTGWHDRPADRLPRRSVRPRHGASCGSITTTTVDLIALIPARRTTRASRRTSPSSTP